MFKLSCFKMLIFALYIYVYISVVNDRTGEKVLLIFHLFIRVMCLYVKANGDVLIFFLVSVRPYTSLRRLKISNKKM